MRVGFLGTAGAVSTARRNNTSLAVWADTLLLVDCSGNPPHALERMGLDWRGLEHVVLTHRHADHVAGVVPLVHQLRVVHRGRDRAALCLWGPAEALEAADALLAAAGLLQDPHGFELQRKPLAAGRDVAVGDLRLNPFSVRHGRAETLGLGVAPLSRSAPALVYSSDTEPCDAVWQHAVGAALLVHECSSYGERELNGHTTLSQLERTLPAGEVERVRLVHLPPTEPSREDQARSRLAARFGDRVQLAADGEVLEL